MVYHAMNRVGRRKLVPNRWIDADKLYAWCITAQTANTSIISERAALLRSLRECFYSSFIAQLAEDDLLIDSTAPEWIDLVQKFFSFLSDRPQVSTKAGPSRQTAADEAVRSGDNLSRAWTTALSTTIAKLSRDQDTIGRAAFEGDLRWE
jgi:hypothetical protein